MKNIIKIFSMLPAAAVLLLLNGCGYHIGFIKHPQINTLAVAPAVNETAIYNAASDIRMMMTEVIVQDGTYKLTDQKHADAIIYLTVKEVKFAESSDASLEDDDTFKPTEWQTQVTVDYSLVIPGQGGKLLSGSVTGDSLFQAPLDLEGSRLRAVRQACYVAAQQVIYSLAEGW